MRLDSEQGKDNRRFGSEPPLGLIVLLVSVPIVGALAYLIIAGVIDNPMIALRTLALYGFGIGVLYIISKQRPKEDA